MMNVRKKILKWTGITLGALVGLIIAAVVAIYVISTVRLNKTYDVPGTALTIPTDAAAIAEGQRQFSTRGCVDCHGPDGAGKMVVDDALIGTVMASNLTAGPGGIASQYVEGADWERAIRQGVGADGKPLVIMPSHEFYPINDGDLANLVAFIQALPAVDHETTPIAVGPLGRILHVTGLVAVVPAEVIDHNAPRPQTIAKAATKEYGEYLAQSCTGCHGKTLSGGPVPGVPSDGPFPRNLTPDVATGLGTWQEADFVRTLRTGVRPDGSTLAAAMPWQAFSAMTDEELSALWLYLQSMPAQPYGNR
ncbi:MAG: c-type cytochrome [Caldilineaceae bacterium]|nr:c-type cytochrome [Caldilineaceae bacterium]